METSAEIRWFWRQGAPSGFREWFCAGEAGTCPAGGGGSEARVDEYLFEAGQAELGVKHRNGKAEIELKGLASSLPEDLDAGVFRGRIELWNRWSSRHLAIMDSASLLVSKRRWIRKFEGSPAGLEEIPLDVSEEPLDKRPRPRFGCSAELTRIELAEGEEWWTFNFEAFGEGDTLGRDLRRAAALLANRNPPRLDGGLLASYPAWLAARLGAEGRG